MEEKHKGIREEAMDVIQNNPIYHACEKELQRQYKKLDRRYDKIGKETKELYAAYMDEYDHITETVTDKYLKLNEKYAQILYKQEFLMTTGKQMKGLSYFKDPLEKIRFKIMCVKWNWTTLQNYDEWHQEPNAITEETSLNDRIKIKTQEKLVEAKKKEKQRERMELLQGPFMDLEQIGREDHPFFRVEQGTTAEIARLGKE